MNKEVVRNIFIGICCSAIVGMASLAFVQYTRLSKIQYQREVQKEVMDSLSNEIAGIEKSMKHYQEEKASFAAQLFDERDVPAFIDEVSKYAKQLSVSVVDVTKQPFQQMQVPKDITNAGNDNHNLNRVNAENIRGSEVKQNLTVSAMVIQFRIKGKFASVVQFFEYVQDYKHLLTIVNAEMQSTAEYPLLDCQLTIRIYALKTLVELIEK